MNITFKSYCLICCCWMMQVFALSFDDLANENTVSQADGKQVTMRGFLYPKEDGSWILAPQPNMKSCCLNTKRHVVVLGDFSNIPSYKAITITGTFIVEPQRYIIKAKI